MEALVQLEQMFIEMLERQEEATAKVLVLDEKRNKQDGKLRRADRIELRSVELLERDLSEKSKEATTKRKATGISKNTFRSAYNLGNENYSETFTDGITEQHHTDQCDINKILA